MRAMHRVQLKGKKRANNLMQMLDLNEVTDLLAVTNSVHWHWACVEEALSCLEKGSGVWC